MPTSVHIPKTLLAQVDKRARELRVSRNRLIVRALENEMKAGSEWSAGFFEELAARGPRSAGATEQMLRAIRARRTRKKPPSL
jgi:hypothetical protein